MKQRNLKCPNCGDKLVPIVYGMPTDFEACDKKEIFLGGCTTADDDPSWHCFGCNRDYYADLKDFECAELSMDDNLKMTEKIANDLMQIIEKLPDGANASIHDLAEQKYGKITRYKSRRHGNGDYLTVDGLDIEGAILEEVLDLILSKLGGADMILVE